MPTEWLTGGWKCGWPFLPSPAVMKNIIATTQTAAEPHDVFCCLSCCINLPSWVTNRKLLSTLVWSVSVTWFLFSWHKQVHRLYWIANQTAADSGKKAEKYLQNCLFVCLFKVGISTEKMVYTKRSYTKEMQKKLKKRRNMKKRR